MRESEYEATVRLRRELGAKSPMQRMTEEGLRFGRKGFARIVELSPTRLNLSWVTSSLAVGGAFHNRHVPRLRQMGITAVVDCREEASDDELALARNGIDFLRLPTPDAHTLSQASLDRGVTWVRTQIVRGAKVYVHCSHGVGRAPELGSCVLVAEGHSADVALQVVCARRWQASPNEEQVLGLLEYAERQRRRAQTLPPGDDELSPHSGA